MLRKNHKKVSPCFSSLFVTFLPVDNNKKVFLFDLNPQPSIFHVQSFIMGFILP